MNIIGDFYRVVFYQPIFNLLVFLYNVIPGTDIGLAIIALTVIIRLILWPLSHQTLRSQRAMQALQPKLKEIQELHKGDKEKQARATMELYSKEKVNPLSSCLPLLVQLPFLFAIYQAMQAGLNQQIRLLYPFVQNPGTIEATFFGLINLAKSSIPLAVVAGLTQYWQTKVMLGRQKPAVPALAGSAEKKEDMAAMMNKQMQYVMPAMTVLIGAGLPAGLALYWLLTNILTVGQQLLYFRKK